MPGPMPLPDKNILPPGAKKHPFAAKNGKRAFFGFAYSGRKPGSKQQPKAPCRKDQTEGENDPSSFSSGCSKNDCASALSCVRPATSS